MASSDQCIALALRYRSLGSQYFKSSHKQPAAASEEAARGGGTSVIQ